MLGSDFDLREFLNFNVVSNFGGWSRTGGNKKKKQLFLPSSLWAFLLPLLVNQDSQTLGILLKSAKTFFFLKLFLFLLWNYSINMSTSSLSILLYTPSW